MLRLEVCSSNKNLRVVAEISRNAVVQLKRVTKFLRGDRSVENIIVAGMQRFFSCNQRNSYRSFL